MKVAVYSAKTYDRQFLSAADRDGHELVFLEPRLTELSAKLAAGFPAVCIFVNDVASAPVLEALAGGGTKTLALRSAGFNHVDLVAAARLGIRVTRVPAYSPYAVAEHTVALILTLNRKVHKAYNRSREGNFALDGLLGFDLHGRTVGVIGTGKIGESLCRIMRGFGCRVVAHDMRPNEACKAIGVEYVPLETLFAESDIVSLHCPLTPETFHLINDGSVAQMKQGVMIVNTGRGGLIDTQAVIGGLKSGKIGYLGLDVYEQEQELFFEDRSAHIIPDDVFSRLLTFPNVIITGHQAFFTQEAIAAIASQTLDNISKFERGEALTNEVKPQS